MRPTQTTHVQPTSPTNTEIQATTIPFTTSTTTTTVTNTTHSSIIATIVAPAVTVTTLLCISIAVSALLCALCMRKKKQDSTTLHSDTKDQQKYSTQ